MTQLEEAAQAIDGVGRLAIFDRSGGIRFGRDMAAALRSFWAYALMLPAILLLIAVSVAETDTATPELLAVTDVIAEIIEIAGFLVLVRVLLRFYGRLDRWAWFVTGYNWFNAAQMALLLGVLGLCAGPLEPFGIWPILATQLYLFVIEAFLAEAILDVGGFKAAGIVLLDALFSFGVDHVARWIGSGHLL